MVGGSEILPDLTKGAPAMGQVHNSNREIRKLAINLLTGRRRVNSIRPINIAFALAEVIWIMAGRNDVEMVAHYNKQMKEYSDNGFTLHGAYGARLYHNDQLGAAVQTLKKDRNSRQATLHIGVPELDNRVVTKDYPCNQYAEMIIRDGKLHWNQHMRSNDIVWGTPYNFIQWGFLHEFVAGWVGAEVGEYCHFVNSAHIYSRHYEHAVKLYETPYANDRDIYTYYEPQDYRLPWPEWVPAFHNLSLLEHQSRTQPGLNVMNCPQFNHIPDSWKNIALVLGAYNAYQTKEHDDEVIEMLEAITNEFKPLLARQLTRLPRSQRYATIPVEVLEHVIDPLESLSKKES
jgi:thymidylate synthase